MKILKRNKVWSFAIYAEGNEYDFSFHPKKIIKLFNTKKIKLKGDSLHTQADPFLISKDNTLYIFYETMKSNQHGKISCIQTKDLSNFQDLGVILDENIHLSYPAVFELKNNFYLMPESSKKNQVSLYKFLNFPFNPEEVRVLLAGNYCDTSLVEHNNIWYLFTTLNGKLYIFYTDDILSGEILPHPKNPVCTDLRYSRCGGSLYTHGGKLFRIAQDCSESYGNNLHILHITAISPTVYSEEVSIENFSKKDESWNSIGSHHISHATFMKKKIIAIDGLQYDYAINKIFSLFFNSYFKLLACIRNNLMKCI